MHCEYVWYMQMFVHLEASWDAHGSEGASLRKAIAKACPEPLSLLVGASSLNESWGTHSLLPVSDGDPWHRTESQVSSCTYQQSLQGDLWGPAEPKAVVLSPSLEHEPFAGPSNVNMKSWILSPRQFLVDLDLPSVPDGGLARVSKPSTFRDSWDHSHCSQPALGDHCLPTLLSLWMTVTDCSYWLAAVNDSYWLQRCCSFYVYNSQVTTHLYTLK